MSLNLYCFNAQRLGDYRSRTNTARVGIMVDWKPELYKHPTMQAAVEHPDMDSFAALDFCPVWAKDLYPAWYQWQCLHGEGWCDIGQMFPALPLVAKPMLLSVGKLMKVYSPFALQRWIWGCSGVTTKEVLKAIKEQSFATTVEHGVNGVGADYHIRRIAYLTVYVDESPIHICTSEINCSRIIVQNGNHRLAAASINKQQSISATLSGAPQLLEDFLYVGTKDPGQRSTVIPASSIHLSD